MAEVEQFVIFVTAYELNTFIDEHETCPIASQSKNTIAIILNICIRKRFAQGRSNILQEEDDENISLEEEVCEEDDKNLSLGMPMQPQEEDNDEQNDEENDEQLENEERKHPHWMHVKCIRELCTITLVFHSYLHHIRGILLLFNDFW